jgi:murein DD-endopeptidase MepM/ murein hydrolase activator NlpD
VTRRQLLWALALAPLAPSGAQTRLSVQGTAAQAFPLFVTLWGEPGEPVEAEWEGKRFAMAWEQDRWRGLVPISIDCKGRQTLRILRGEQVLQERVVPVKPRDYGMQYLSISPSTLASYDKPQNKADDQAILAAMKKFEPQALWQGPFTLPVDAPESTGFGQRRLYNGWKKGWHKGLDLAGWEGQEVTAPADGVVVHRARGIVNGNTLVLGHGLGLFTVYLHLYGWDVDLGERVQAGQKIAAVGGTGGFAPHLHWEARVFGVPVHPKAFFQLPRGF